MAEKPNANDDFTSSTQDKGALAYTGESIENEQGIRCRVIDVEKTDFSKATPGRKSAVTLVVEAKGGENTAQIFENSSETNWPYEAQEGDAIFVQGDIRACMLYMNTGEIAEKHGAIDIYVPDNAKLSETGRLQYKDLEAEGYEIQPGDPNKEGTYVKSPSALILHKANAEWACIALPGKQVKFFPPGSSFKLLDGDVSGINPEAFEQTWELLDDNAGPSTSNVISDMPNKQ